MTMTIECLKMLFKIQGGGGKLKKPPCIFSLAYIYMTFSPCKPPLFLFLSIFVIANTIMFLVIMTKAFPVATLITILRELDLAGAEGVAIAGEGAEVVVDF